MAVTQRDALHHTYGEYLTWPEGNFAELINGTAYVRESPATVSYGKVTKLPVYEQAGVQEVWLVDPIERILSIYRLQDKRYERPTIVELKGRTTIAAIPGVVIDWDRLAPWSA